MVSEARWLSRTRVEGSCALADGLTAFSSSHPAIVACGAPLVKSLQYTQVEYSLLEQTILIGYNRDA